VLTAPAIAAYDWVSGPDVVKIPHTISAIAIEASNGLGRLIPGEQAFNDIAWFRQLQDWLLLWQSNRRPDRPIDKPSTEQTRRPGSDSSLRGPTGIGKVNSDQVYDADVWDERCRARGRQEYCQINTADQTLLILSCLLCGCLFRTDMTN
jgi:hypothetical protein